MPDSRNLYGRTVIYTDVDEVTAENISDVLDAALDTHQTNLDDIDYLYSYYKGDAPIKDRTKLFNDTVNNKIVVNYAYQITEFKIGYLLSAPIQYTDVAANDSEENVENSDLVTLSNWMRSEGKSRHDMTLARWQSICGTAYRLVFPRAERLDDSVAPFEIYDLDPRYTFVVYSSKLGHKPMLGCSYVTLEDDTLMYYCYTDKEYFVLDDDFNVVERQGHVLTQVPIVEYPLNDARLGDWEIVNTILDAIDTTESNRVDAVEQFVQAILCVRGMQIDDGSTFMQRLQEMKGIQLPEGGDAFYLTLAMNQGDNQTLIDNFHQEIIEICGLPNRNGGSSTSDTGQAVLLRDGWSDAEARAVQTQTMFEESERRFLSLAVLICNTMGGTNLFVNDIDITFPRRNYTNDSANVDNLLKLLSSDWIRPEFAYEHCNLTPDPHKEYLLAKKWHEDQEAATVDSLTGMSEDENVEEVIA